MTDSTLLTEIVKSADASKTIISLLGYQFLSPSVDAVGTGMSQIIRDNLERVREVILRKRKEKDSEMNFRIAMEGFRSAVFLDSKIAAEYFGGILASSGASGDDALMSHLAIVKDLSSKQLFLHYVIYRSIHNITSSLNKTWKNRNLGLNSDINNLKIVFSGLEFDTIKLSPAEDSEILYRAGLISSYKYDQLKVDSDHTLPYVEFSPTTLGFQLYAAVQNEYENWREVLKLDLPTFPDIELPSIYFESLEQLSDFA